MSQVFHTNRKKFFTLLATTMFMVLSMLSIGTSFALDPNGIGYAQPLSSVADKWVEIQPGEVQWYMLDYDPQVDDDESDARFQPVSIWMDVVPDEQDINFSVWSPDRLERLVDESGDVDDAPALGGGSMNDYTPGDYYWAGEYFERATLYVAVENKSNHTRYYSINSANKHH